MGLLLRAVVTAIAIAVTAWVMNAIWPDSIKWGQVDYGQGELGRYLSLLLTAPQGIDVVYTYAGEISIDGTPCDAVNAAFGGSTFKLFISRASSLPVAMTYTGMRMPEVIKFRHADPVDDTKEKGTMVFTTRLDASADSAEFTVKFADYRSTGGVQLPYRWTTTAGDKTVETFEVTSYDVNPADIANRFNGSGGQRVMIRTTKPDTK